MEVVVDFAGLLLYLRIREKGIVDGIGAEKTFFFAAQLSHAPSVICGMPLLFVPRGLLFEVDIPVCEDLEPRVARNLYRTCPDNSFSPPYNV